MVISILIFVSWHVQKLDVQHGCIGMLIFSLQWYSFAMLLYELQLIPVPHGCCWSINVAVFAWINIGHSSHSLYAWVGDEINKVKIACDRHLCWAIPPAYWLTIVYIQHSFYYLRLIHFWWHIICYQSLLRVKKCLVKIISGQTCYSILLTR